MSWTAALLTSTVLLGGVCLVGATRRRASSAHVRVNGNWVVRARIARQADRQPTVQERLERWWQARAAASYLHGEWRREIPYTAVHLSGMSATRRPVRVNADYEVDFLRPQRPLSQLRLQMQVAALTLSALVAALVTGRGRPSSSAPPHTRYAPGGPAGVGVMPARWLMSSLATPSPHPFRTSTAASTPGVNLSHSNVPAGGHTNTALVPHGNAVTHTNAITAHTNIDSRPIAGPF